MDKAKERVCRLLGCRYPVLQGAMSLVSNPELVAAVSGAGGFGVLASAPMPAPGILRDQIRRTRALTGRPFGVNLVGFNPRSREMALVAIEEGIGAVTMSAGLAPELVALVKAAGLTVVAVVPSVALACRAEQLGADIIVAEGMESGGAQGEAGISTMTLVPAVADAVSVPVIAAGGIADRRGYLAARALGAAGIQMGTRFLASAECWAHDKCKELICKAEVQSTALIPLRRFRARVLQSPAVRRYLNDPSPKALAALERVQERVFLDGETDLGPVAAGQSAGLIRTVKPVAEIIAEILGPETATRQ